MRVASKRVQWYHHELKGMEHFIPIRENLSNLEESIIWCRKNLKACQRIAENGRRLAKKIVENLDDDINDSIENYTKNWVRNDQ